MKAFNHNFKTPLSDKEINKMNGFILALKALQERLCEMTEWKPEKRFIDAVDLLESITATTDELTPMMEQAKAILVHSELH